MPRNKTEQIPLIDVLPENVKKIRALIRRRDEFHEAHLDNKKKADDLDEKIWAEVQAAGGTIDEEGKLTMDMGDDEALEVKKGKARLSITLKSKKKKPDDAGQADE